MTPEVFIGSIMHNQLLFSLLILSTSLFCQQSENTYAIIPKPQKVIPASGTFTITRSTALCASFRQSAEIKKLAYYIAEFLSVPVGEIQFSRSIPSNQEYIALDIDEKNDFATEGYQLSVTPEGIQISASTVIGAFWAFQTLRQLMPPIVEMQVPLVGAKIVVPCVTIIDAPRFAYRGLHLDVSRHMFPVEFIKKYIDLMAFYKLNTFHWHLTDDQGWRIEIKQYPKLQELSAFRRQTLIGSGRTYPRKYDGKNYGGYYTQEEVKDIIEYAHQRHITIIPEIELPGHSLAALAAYPELGCSKGPYETGTCWGINDDVYCPGNENTFLFLENVLKEVMDLFPSTYIHIGGDEVEKNRWRACNECQTRIQNEGLQDEFELQSYVIKRIEKFVNKHGRTIIGWDEILEGGLADNAIVMSWRETEGAIEAAQHNNRVIMTSNEYLYFDYYQSKSPHEPLAIGGFLPLEKVYSFEPVPSVLNKSQAPLILGAQANVWTEYITTQQQVEYMAFPRALALAEVAWTESSNKNYDNFVERLDDHIEHLRALNVYYAPYKELLS